MRISHLTTVFKYCLTCFTFLVYVEEYLKYLVPCFLNLPSNKNCHCSCYELMHHLTASVLKCMHYYYVDPDKVD